MIKIINLSFLHVLKGVLKIYSFVTQNRFIGMLMDSKSNPLFV